MTPEISRCDKRTPLLPADIMWSETTIKCALTCVCIGVLMSGCTHSGFYYTPLLDVFVYCAIYSTWIVLCLPWLVMQVDKKTIFLVGKVLLHLFGAEIAMMTWGQVRGYRDVFERALRLRPLMEPSLSWLPDVAYCIRFSVTVACMMAASQKTVMDIFKALKGKVQFLKQLQLSRHSHIGDHRNGGSNSHHGSAFDNESNGNVHKEIFENLQRYSNMHSQNGRKKVNPKQGNHKKMYSDVVDEIPVNFKIRPQAVACSNSGALCESNPSLDCAMLQMKTKQELLHEERVQLQKMRNKISTDNDGKKDDSNDSLDHAMLQQTPKHELLHEERVQSQFRKMINESSRDNGKNRSPIDKSMLENNCTETDSEVETMWQSEKNRLRDKFGDQEEVPYTQSGGDVEMSLNQIHKDQSKKPTIQNASEELKKHSKTRPISNKKRLLSPIKPRPKNYNQPAEIQKLQSSPKVRNQIENSRLPKATKTQGDNDIKPNEEDSPILRSRWKGSPTRQSGGTSKPSITNVFQNNRPNIIPKSRWKGGSRAKVNLKPQSDSKNDENNAEDNADEFTAKQTALPRGKTDNQKRKPAFKNKSSESPAGVMHDDQNKTVSAGNISQHIKRLGPSQNSQNTIKTPVFGKTSKPSLDPETAELDKSKPHWERSPPNWDNRSPGSSPKKKTSLFRKLEKSPSTKQQSPQIRTKKK